MTNNICIIINKNEEKITKSKYHKKFNMSISEKVKKDTGNILKGGFKQGKNQAHQNHDEFNSSTEKNPEQINNDNLKNYLGNTTKTSYRQNQNYI